MRQCVQLAIALISAATLCSAQVPAGIKIRDLRISGDTQIAATKVLEGCATELRSRTYDQPDWVDVVANRYRFCLQDEGYFKAAVEAEPKQLPDKDGWHQFDLTLKIQAGSKYLLGDMIFKNVRILNASELRPLFRIKPGDVFNAGLIREGMEQLRRTYTERGYSNFTIVPETKVDEVRHVIDVVFDCVGLYDKGQSEKAQALPDTFSGEVIGGIISSVPVTGSKGGQAQRVRISSVVADRNVISKVQPAYPATARDAHIQGSCVLKALIDKEGRVTDLTAISGHPLLLPAAMDAVKKWHTSPLPSMVNLWTSRRW